ncbi:MAG TPA: L-ribulose-5-phosphate 4-epimerase AraD [Kiritimatiellia bacterium]|nr:L-ribulose-5-phosphate 4-epimerase AraD [Kiritimatiellia bacterium]
MKFQKLRSAVCEANRAIVRAELVVLTWGNASAVDRAAGVMAIKPSGVDYDALRPQDIVLVSLEDGTVVDSSLRPSSDTPTHLHLYRAFPAIGGVVHTHSTHATAWAQLNRPLPCFGTTHADHFHGAVPVARPLTKAEIDAGYEHATGVSIVETFTRLGLDPAHVPAVFLPGHAPFTWGPDAAHAVDNAIALEAVAKMALLMGAAERDLPPLVPEILEKHFQRKHGPKAYYGQSGHHGG